MKEVVISKFFWNFQNFFRVFATSTSSDIVSSFFNKVIFSLDLFSSERNNFTVCQNFLLSVIFFTFNFAKYCSFSFLRRDTQKFLCLVKTNLFSSVGFFKNLFLKRVLRNVLVMKGLLFPRMHFFFWGHDDSIH